MDNHRIIHIVFDGNTNQIYFTIKQKTFTKTEQKSRVTKINKSAKKKNNYAKKNNQFLKTSSSCCTLFSQRWYDGMLLFDSFFFFQPII